MKRWGLLLMAALLSADGEVERIEGIVQEVGQLRSDYRRCRSELSELLESAAMQRERCEAQIGELEAVLEEARSEERKAERALLQLVEERTRLKRRIALLEGAQKPPTPPKGASCPEVNPFPKLIMKGE